MISNRTINSLIAYFEAKETRNEQEQLFLGILNNHSDVFPITGVSREDLESRGFDGSKISDEQMDDLARRMSDDYHEQIYWDSMENIATLQGFPTKSC